MKNELESDKTYLRSDEAIRGYFFVTFLALRIYFKILQRLREKGLTTDSRRRGVLCPLKGDEDRRTNWAGVLRTDPQARTTDLLALP